MDDDRDYQLPLMPLPDDTLSSVIAFCLFWAVTLGLVYPAWLVGSPWGWFAYAGTFILLCGVMELRSLANILVRTLPALRLVWMETERLRRAEERRGTSGGHERGSA
jgi:hypothetical protein